MTDATKFQFTDASVAKARDEYLVPRLFEPWARKLLEEVELKSGEIILDIATGPGTVARLAASKVGSDGHVFAIDLSKQMLDMARAKPASACAARIEYLQSPPAPLPGSSGIFDAVLCQQGLQSFPDRLAALREMRRVLKPDGRAAIAVWAALERNRIFAAYHAAVFGHASLAGRRSTLSGGPEGVLHPRARGDGDAADRWQNRRRDGFEYHRRQTLIRAWRAACCALALLEFGRRGEPRGQQQQVLLAGDPGLAKDAVQMGSHRRGRDAQLAGGFVEAASRQQA